MGWEVECPVLLRSSLERLVGVAQYPQRQCCAENSTPASSPAAEPTVSGRPQEAVPLATESGREEKNRNIFEMVMQANFPFYL